MRTVQTAKKEALRLLQQVGIRESFTVKVRAVTAHGGDAVAQYRSLSQFGRKPIFWISPKYADNYDIAVDSFLHEYGHVVWEWAHKRGTPELLDLIVTISSDNEEWFAEAFAHALRNGSSVAHLKAATMYGAILERL